MRFTSVNELLGFVGLLRALGLSVALSAIPTPKEIGVYLSNCSVITEKINDSHYRLVISKGDKVYLYIDISKEGNNKDEII